MLFHLCRFHCLCEGIIHNKWDVIQSSSNSEAALRLKSTLFVPVNSAVRTQSRPSNAYSRILLRTVRAIIFRYFFGSLGSKYTCFEATNKAKYLTLIQQENILFPNLFYHLRVLDRHISRFQGNMIRTNNTSVYYVSIDILPKDKLKDVAAALTVLLKSY